MKAKGIFAQLGSALDKARGDLDELRDRIADTKEHIAAIEAAPDDAAAIAARVDAAIAEAQAEKPVYFSGLVRADAADIGIQGFMLRAMERDPFGVFAAICPAELREALLADMPGDGMTADERAAQRAHLMADLRTCEIAEELACRKMEATLRALVPRRADANPEILLAPDEQLQEGHRL